jgi:hypothetical protein
MTRAMSWVDSGTSDVTLLQPMNGRRATCATLITLLDVAGPHREGQHSACIDSAGEVQRLKLELATAYRRLALASERRSRARVQR